MKKYKVILIGGSSVKVEARNRNHAFGLGKAHGLVSDVQECNDAWLLIFPVLAVLGCLFFSIAST